MWGSDNHYQLDLSQMLNTHVHNLLKQINMLLNIRIVSFGEKHLIFVIKDSDVFVNGCNPDSRFGIDDKWSFGEYSV
jgi:alpha-tubulin suppressor-like RCC1 family protein